MKNPDKRIVCKKRYWCADPFIVEDENCIFLFAEILDRNISRGKLGYAKIDQNLKIKIEPNIDIGCHTSYPEIFKYKNIWYMIPETSERKTIELYKANNFPNGWVKECALIHNIFAVDTTIFFKDGRCFIFIYEPKGKENILSIGEIDLAEKKMIRKKVVKCYSNRIGRPAGKILLNGDRMIRPTQYCINYYGEKVILKEFTFDTESFEYREWDTTELEIKNILNDSKAFGLHTYNKCNKLEVIDYCKNRFFLFKPFSILFKRFKMFGYSFNN